LKLFIPCIVIYNPSHLQTHAHVMISKCKGKFQPTTGHEGPDGE